MAGQVRAFIRLSGCNLHCHWCDTPYTWNWRGTTFSHADDRKFDVATEVARLAPDDAADRVLSLNAPGVVLTGGEPMMQGRALLALAHMLRARAPGFRLEIETNGTFAPGPEMIALIDLFMVSPKLDHSGNPVGSAILGVDHFRDVAEAQFKFVARTAADVDSVARLTDGIAPERIFIMPEGRTPAELDRHLAVIAEPALRLGFSLTDRQHIRLFGDTRGT